MEPVGRGGAAPSGTTVLDDDITEGACVCMRVCVRVYVRGGGGGGRGGD
jgi:hypothetical protein